MIDAMMETLLIIAAISVGIIVTLTAMSIRDKMRTKTQTRLMPIWDALAVASPPNTEHATTDELHAAYDTLTITRPGAYNGSVTRIKNELERRLF